MYVCMKIVTGFDWNQEAGIRDGADINSTIEIWKEVDILKPQIEQAAENYECRFGTDWNIASEWWCSSLVSFFSTSKK